MELTVNGQVVDEPLTDELIERAIFAMTSDSDSFVILARDRMTYIQTAGDEATGFLLEYQEGSLEKHYSCTDRDLSTSDVIEAFQRYRAGDTRWRSDLSWELGDAGVGLPASVRTVLLAVVVVIVALIAWFLLKG